MARLEAVLGEGEGFRVFGPAELEVLDGIVTLLGAELERGARVRISEHRSYLVKAHLGDARVRLSLGAGARVEEPGPDEEPLDLWVKIADLLLDACGLPCSIAVLGPMEAGKTSFAALLANRALAQGLAPAIVDADVGQADVGPPAFVSLAFASDWVFWLRDLEADYMRFVGSIEPGPATGRILSAVAELVARAREEGASLVVVDTDGWVEGWSAIEYKSDLLRVADIDYGVVLGDLDLYRSLEPAARGRIFYAGSPAVVAERSREDRRSLRSDNYRRFLEGASSVEVKLSSVDVQGSCVAASDWVNDEKVYSEAEAVLGARVVYVGRFPGGYCIVVDSPDPVDLERVKELGRRLGGEAIVVYTGGFRGVLAAVSGGGSDYPALLESLDVSRGKAVLSTRYQGPIRRVAFGRVRLGDDYREVGRRRIWV